MQIREFDFEQQPGLQYWNRTVVKTDSPLVSIITPYYNSGKHIHQTCNCVLNQTFPYFEWIIVNDGSTGEDDLRILEEIKTMDSRIRILHKENAGPSIARNYGFHHATADLILPLDADDLLEPTFIEYCWWMLKKNPDAAWAYTDSVGFQGQEYLWSVPFHPIRMKKENLLTITALIRKDIFLSIGGYGEEVKFYNEDWEAWLKLIAKGHYPVQCQGDYLFWYRRGNTGVQSSIQEDTERSKRNAKIIENAASLVKNPHEPVIYPQNFTYNWERPVLSDWDKCIYQEKNKKHILFLLPHMEMGGADKFNLDLMAGLDHNKYDFGLITTIQNIQSWQQAFRTVTPHIFNLANFVDPRDYAEFISYYIKSRKVDILFLSNSYHGYYLVPWLREQFPELVIVDYVHMEEWYWRNGGYARTSAMIGEITEKTYVCNSATKDVMLSNFQRKPDSVETIHIGVDADYFAPEKVESGILYRELSLPEKTPVVLFICRLHPQKRPFLMLEIAKRVKQQIPNVVFAVVGDGPQEEELHRKALTMGLGNCVYFMGSKKDVRPYYRDAKLTLVCSLKEGLSLTAYESCAMGIPVISSDVGGQKDLVNANTGALIPCLQTEDTSLDLRTFPEEEIRCFTNAIVQFLTNDDLWENTSRNCRENICRSFTIQKMIERLDIEFTRLTENPDLAEHRREISLSLQRLQPLAAELFVTEMELHWLESLQEYHPLESLPRKIYRVWKVHGTFGLIKRIIAKVKHHAFS